MFLGPAAILQSDLNHTEIIETYVLSDTPLKGSTPASRVFPGSLENSLKHKSGNLEKEIFSSVSC